MCMGGGKKTTTENSTAKTSVALPDWLNNASQTAVQAGTKIASTPFTSYGSELTPGLTANQMAASSLAARSGNPSTAATDYAKANMGAGQSSADLDAMLAKIGAGTALGSQDAGLSDLQSARDYTAASAAPITAADISGYINPYINQAIDPVAAKVRETAAQTGKQIDNTAAMSGAFGGSRSGLREATNDSNLNNTMSTLYGGGYRDAYDKALAQVNSDMARKAGAAGLSLSTATGATSQADDALKRLLDSATATGQAGALQSNLSTDALTRLTGAQSADNNLTNDALTRLMATGKTEQDTNAAADTAKYNEFLRGQGWSSEQLAALLAAINGTSGAVDKTTTTDSSGTSVSKSSTPLLAQIAALFPSQ